MDINSIANNEIRTFMAETQRQQAAVGQFQDILEKAKASQTTEQTASQANGWSEGLSEKEDKALKEACQSFESYFLQLMFREMRKTQLDANGFINKSNAEKMFTDMLDEEVSKSAVNAGGIGLAEMMYAQMTK